MQEDEVRSFVDRYWVAEGGADLDALAAMYSEDAVQEWPQSGERVVGRDNIMAITGSYPGLPKATVRRIRGSGDGPWVVELTLDYGGERYESANILEFSNGVIVRETDYFATPFDPPAWRAQWTETF